MVPPDGSFTTAIAKDNHKAGEIHHSRSINLLRVMQTRIGADKMDCDTAGHNQERYDEDPERSEEHVDQDWLDEVLLATEEFDHGLYQQAAPHKLRQWSDAGYTALKRCRRTQRRTGSSCGPPSKLWAGTHHTSFVNGQTQVTLR